MGQITNPTGSAHGTIFGFPLRGFGLLSGLLLSFAAGLFTFCAVTCISIFALLGWNQIGHHTVNYADSYLYIGFPASMIVLVVALPFFLTLWIRATVRR